MIRVVHPGFGSRILILTFYPSRIPDPGVKKAPDPGSRIRIRNTPLRSCCVANNTKATTPYIVVIFIYICLLFRVNVGFKNLLLGSGRH
jgi:hypothetical protein